MKKVKLKDVNNKKWKAKKGDQQNVDRGLSTHAITTTMQNVEKTMGDVKQVLDLNLLVSKRLLTAVEALSDKINPS